MKISISLEIETEETFSVEEFWPDGNAPEPAAINEETVRGEIRKSLSIRDGTGELSSYEVARLMRDWGSFEEGLQLRVSVWKILEVKDLLPAFLARKEGEGLEIFQDVVHDLFGPSANLVQVLRQRTPFLHVNNDDESKDLRTFLNLQLKSET